MDDMTHGDGARDALLLTGGADASAPARRHWPLECHWGLYGLGVLLVIVSFFLPLEAWLGAMTRFHGFYVVGLPCLFVVSTTLAVRLSFLFRSRWARALVVVAMVPLLAYAGALAAVLAVWLVGPLLLAGGLLCLLPLPALWLAVRVGDRLARHGGQPR